MLTKSSGYFQVLRKKSLARLSVIIQVIRLRYEQVGSWQDFFIFGFRHFLLFYKTNLKIRLLIAFALFLWVLPGSEVLGQETAYKRTPQDSMNLKLHFTNRGLRTSVLQKSSGQSLQLAPDNRNFIGVGAYFWRLGVKLYLPLPVSWFFNQAEEFSSRVIDLQAGLYLDKWMFDGSLQWYSQLYPASENIPSDIVKQASDNQLTSLQSYLTVTYLFTEDQVSFKSSYNRNEMQLRSAGSWMLSGGLSYYTLRGQNSIFDPSQRIRFGTDSLISQLSATAFQLRPGYVYNFVFGKFMLHGAASVGLAFQNKSFTKPTVSGNSLGVAPEYNLRASIGYDDGKYFASLFLVLQQSSLSIEGIRLDNSSRNIQFFVGYRLPTPAWLKNLRPALMDKILPLEPGKH